MERLIWTPVKRKRCNTLPYTSTEYVLGYDLDMEDFTQLVATYNTRALLRDEENRLYDHIRTMVNIVLENPKLKPSKDEIDGITDSMFMDGWGALKYIKGGKKPYSYIYRSMYTAACRFYTRKIKEREKAEAIADHVNEVFTDWLESVTDHKKRCPGVNYDA